MFVCENNLYSVYTPIEERQNPLRKITQIAEAHGITSNSGDGNSIEDVCTLSSQAIDYIRERKKPYFLEFSTYRWLEHCGPNWDDHLGYRKKNELKQWMTQCPIKKCEKDIKDEKIISDNDFRMIAESIDLEIQEAFEFAKSSPFPNSDGLFDNVYA